MEEDQNSSMEEVAPHGQESNVVEAEGQIEENPQVEENHELQDKQDRNWKELRRKQREAEIRESAKDELIEKLLRSRNSDAGQEKAPEPDEFANIDPDDFLTRDQTDKRIDKKAEAIAERKYQELRAREERSRFVERLESKYSDFQDVVNPDSIAIFEEKEPELASTIAELKDPYKMGLQTYHYLKRMNLSGEASNKRHAKEVEKKIEKNEKSVQSPQAYNKRPMAQAFRMTESEKTKLFEEMMGHAGRSGGGY